MVMAKRQNRGSARATALLERRGRRSSTKRRNQADSKSISAAPQSILLTKADLLSRQGEWKQALRVLDAAYAAAIDTDERRHVLEQIAVTAADGSKHRVSSAAVYELSQIEPRPASSWLALAEVALVRGNYLHADTAAREALEEAPESDQAWATLAASYYGLGWFDEADQCMQRTDLEHLSTRHKQRLGIAINSWAMSKSRALVIGVMASVLVGVLGIAIGACVPLIARDIRLRSLNGRNDSVDARAMAESAWRSQRGVRAAYAISIAASVAVYLAAVLS